MAISIVTKYITKDDFKVYFGIDLDVELRNSGNPSNTAEAFLKRNEDRMAIYLDSQYFKNIDNEFGNFTKEQKELYSKALLEQAYYIFKNGDIITDSGYDFEKGNVASSSIIMQKWLSPMAKNYLMKCGLLTRKQSRRRFGLHL